MENEGTSYNVVHCKECGSLIFVKPGSLSRYCNSCGKKKILQVKEMFSAHRDNATARRSLRKERSVINVHH